jgi:hypothetical protein
MIVIGDTLPAYKDMFIFVTQVELKDMGSVSHSRIAMTFNGTKFRGVQKKKMSVLEQGHVILGLNEEGRKLRPSDWTARIASVYGHFDASHRLRYNPNIMPVHYGEQNCLFVAGKLADDNPAAYQHVMEFVRNNRLQVQYFSNPDTPEPSAEFHHAA